MHVRMQHILQHMYACVQTSSHGCHRYHACTHAWTHRDLNPGPYACEADVIPPHHVPNWCQFGRVDIQQNRTRHGVATEGGLHVRADVIIGRDGSEKVN